MFGKHLCLKHSFRSDFMVSACSCLRRFLASNHWYSINVRDTAVLFDFLSGFDTFSPRPGSCGGEIVVIRASFACGELYIPDARPLLDLTPPLFPRSASPRLASSRHASTLLSSLLFCSSARWFRVNDNSDEQWPLSLWNAP